MANSQKRPSLNARPASGSADREQQERERQPRPGQARALRCAVGEAAEDEHPAEVDRHRLEVRLAPEPFEQPADEGERRAAGDRVRPYRRVAPPVPRLALEEPHAHAPPGRERRQRERPHDAGVVADRQRRVEHRDHEEVPRPVGAERGEAELHVREVGRGQQRAEEEQVVEGQVGRRDLAPREARGLHRDPRQARRRRRAEPQRDGQRPDAVEVLLDQQRRPAGDQGHPEVERDAQLGAQRDELAPRDAGEERAPSPRAARRPRRGVGLRRRLPGPLAREHSSTRPTPPRSTATHRRGGACPRPSPSHHARRRAAARAAPTNESSMPTGLARSPRRGRPGVDNRMRGTYN